MPRSSLSAETFKPGIWPALLDLFAATLMVFILVTFLQKLLSLEELETLWIRQQQEQFVDLTREYLSEEIARGDLGVTRDQNALVLTFSDQLLFESGDYRLKPEGVTLLERCRLLLANRGEERYEWVQVEGHTDPLPLRRTEYPSNNWQLSAARAISVIELLSADSAIDPARLSASGYASFRPVADNDSQTGRALNRRIEMRIFFAGPTTKPKGTSRIGAPVTETTP